MSNLTSTAARIAAIRTVGKGIRMTDIVVADILSGLPEGFDYKVRGAVAAVVHAWANGDATPPPVKTGPKGNQTTTAYGRGHDTITSAVKRALSTPPAKTERLTVTYVDAEGKSHAVVVTRESDATLYANLVSLANATASE